MEFRVIKRREGPEEVIIEPTVEGGIFAAEIFDSSFTGEFIDAFGQGILLKNIPADAIERLKEEPDFTLDQFIKPNPKLAGIFNLTNGAKGIIYEKLDRRSEPVRPHKLALGFFREYIPYLKGQSSDQERES